MQKKCVIQPLFRGEYELSIGTFEKKNCGSDDIAGAFDRCLSGHSEFLREKRFKVWFFCCSVGNHLSECDQHLFILYSLFNLYIATEPLVSFFICGEFSVSPFSSPYLRLVNFDMLRFDLLLLCFLHRRAILLLQNQPFIPMSKLIRQLT
ncbi:hypothetical protein Y032_0033g2703 [Ancylostoma ceylanicum]|uniref:Uncharacterized protein n=1 Tax=Ancylostoma ceylanicum TaxID=53326 RepID=A0A016UMW7_9BILA|nr:hypothetical protein Y032_0033g2703 [Ancylostoma ceylanicum]